MTINHAQISIKHFLTQEHTMSQAGVGVLVYDVDSPVASPLDHRRHVAYASLPRYILPPRFGRV